MDNCLVSHGQAVLFPPHKDPLPKCTRTCYLLAQTSFEYPLVEFYTNRMSDNLLANQYLQIAMWNI